MPARDQINLHLRCIVRHISGIWFAIKGIARAFVA
jgi:hypothetical protein